MDQENEKLFVFVICQPKLVTETRSRVERILCRGKVMTNTLCNDFARQNNYGNPSYVYTWSDQ